MDLTRNAMEYIAELTVPNLVQHEGEVFADKKLYRIDKELRAAPITVHTLTSFLDYILSGVDPVKGRMIVHVVSPERVELISALDSDRKRETLMIAEALIPEFNYGRFISHENFLIALQSNFLPTEDRDILFRFAGTVESGSVAQYGDDGVTQKATVKTGVASKGDAIVPNPVVLRPFRTFTELDQPESSFVFRMRDDRGEVSCALFEADGGAWRNAAIHNIAEFILDALDGMSEQVTVIN